MINQRVDSVIEWADCDTPKQKIKEFIWKPYGFLLRLVNKIGHDNTKRRISGDSGSHQA